MFRAIARRFFGSANDRFIRKLKKGIQAINALETQMQALNDAELRACTDLLRARLIKGESLDTLLVDAFATVREVAKRTLGQRPFDVQLLGGLVLHQGKVVEMKTGEGKTLVATLPVYLNALSGRGVHVVTVNDYLAHRDAEWMGQIYHFLGISVGVIAHDMDDSERRSAYACDVTYGTNNELGFDYLRDNMKFRLEELVQRPFHYAIVDEVDSILIDEARTPLVISGPSEDFSSLYTQVDRLICHLNSTHFERDDKLRTVTLTEEGVEHMQNLLAQAGLLKSSNELYDISNLPLVHHVNQALRAHQLFTRDADYIVKDNKVVIVDEFTGRMMEGRRYSDGLHQALEAKEGVSVQNENQTLASITFQNYFRLYPKLAGMTGTAMTEASEFQEIYGLDVVAIPTNVDSIRKDMDDEIYRTAHEKYEAIVNNIKACYARWQPVLVGTTSIEKSELLSRLLQEANIPHKVLNARYHEQEAHIIADAGTPGAVTIATNMAGRGTDIQLGGNVAMRLKQKAELNQLDETAQTYCINKLQEDFLDSKRVAVEAGGLFVIGTERHESRRVDNQLRGRSGRQGDPGASKFFLSLEDDLMRIFGSERMDKVLQTLGLQRGEAIIHPWINKALEKAQQKVEARNFDIRKNLLKFDDVVNDQRKIIYEQRREIIASDDVHQIIVDMRYQTIANLASFLIQERPLEHWDSQKLGKECVRVLNAELSIIDWTSENLIKNDVVNRLIVISDQIMEEKLKRFGPDTMRIIEKNVLLQVLDQVWKEHLLVLDHLRQGIGLRAYGQRDPLNEYKQEAFSLFEHVLVQLRERVTEVLSHVEVQFATATEDSAFFPHNVSSLPEAELSLLPVTEEASSRPAFSESPSCTLSASLKKKEEHSSARHVRRAKARRNDLCPCGSGRKFKNCHGQRI